jgi:hypothetical protein
MSIKLLVTLNDDPGPDEKFCDLCFYLEESIDNCALFDSELDSDDTGFLRCSECLRAEEDCTELIRKKRRL